MTDEELEQLLGRHYPTGPHPSLRARVLHAASAQRGRVRLGVFDYALAGVAAALLVTAMILQPSAAAPPAQATRDREISEIAEALGGGLEARRYAALVVSREAELVDPAVTEASW